MKTLVIGLGKTGFSVAAFLAGEGALVTTTDLRSREEIGLDETGALTELGVSVETGTQDVSLLGGVELIVVSPGVPSDISLLEEAQARGIKIVSAMELASRFIDLPIVAVTGTNGKTTATTLIAEVLERAGRKVFVGGNIGTPAIECVDTDRGYDICVLEVSSFQLEWIETFRPQVAVILNITEDHLYRYSDFMDYARTKFRILSNQGKGDIAILNLDDSTIAGSLEAREIDGRLVGFSATAAASVSSPVVTVDGDYIVYTGAGSVERYPLNNRTSPEVCMATIAATRFYGVESRIIREVLSGFAGLEHRIEPVATKGGVTYINDSKATNVGAVVKALEGIGGEVVLIAGGVDKGGDYGLLSPLVSEKVRLAVLTGPAGAKLKEAIGECAECVLAESFDDAVKIASEGAKEGDTVLLSPACSSFDEFKSYEERGDRFKSLVGAL